MSIDTTDFYSGFEGENEIVFSRCEPDGMPLAQIRMWEGYFDALMQQVPPASAGWQHLAYHYHLASGWEDEESWRISGLRDTALQWEGIDTDALSTPLPEIHAAVASLMNTALRSGHEVRIAKE